MTNPTQNILRARGNILIEAAAGTGKTHNLTEKVIHLLRSKTNIAQILAVTFTELAAAEMRARIYDRLTEEIANEPDAALRAFLLKQKQEFHRNRITTIHGFCYRLITHYPEEISTISIGIEPESLPAHTDDARARIAADGGAGVIGTYDQVLLEEELRRTFYTMYQNLPALVRQLDRLGKYNFEAFLDKMIAFPAEYMQPVAAYTRAAYDTMIQNSVQRLQAELSEAVKSFTADVKNHPHWFKKPIERAGSATEFVSMMFTKTLTPLARGVFHEAYKPEAAAILTPAATIIKKNESLLALSTPEREALVYENLTDLAELSLRWQSLLRYHRFRKHRLSFDDIIMLAHHLVTGNPGVAGDIRQRFEYILVDEFQDTDRQQWEILRSVSRAGTSGNLLLVGDVKQAIYEFRGGNVAMFNEARQTLEAYEKAGTALLRQPLQASFRSNRAIIDFTNAFFRHVFSDGGNGDSDKPYLARPQDLHLPDDPNLGNRSDGRVTIFRMRSGDPELTEAASRLDIPAGNAEANAEIEARWIASCIRDIQEGKHPEYDGITQLMKEGKPAIGILLRSRTRQWMIEKALNAFGVPYKSLSGNGFYGRQEVRDVYYMLRFLMDAYDNLALSAVLRSPFGGVSDAGLLALRMHAGPVKPAKTTRFNASFWEPLEKWGDIENQLIPPDAAMLKIRVEQLKEWRIRVKTERISDLLEEIISTTGFFSGFSDQEATRLNIWKLLEVIRELESTGSGSLMEITRFLNYQLTEGKNEKDADVPESGSVQLLTIHGSKGLQFPMVILPHLNGRQGGSGKDVYIRPLDETHPEKGEFPLMAYKIADKDGGINAVEGDTLLGCLLKEKMKDRELAETKRLFYVAQTRAASHLFLFDTRKKNYEGSTETSFSDILNSWQEYEKAVSGHSALFKVDSMNSNTLKRLFESNEHQTVLPVHSAACLHRTQRLNDQLAGAQAASAIASDSEKPEIVSDETVPSDPWVDIQANEAGTLIHFALEYPDLLALPVSVQKQTVLAQAVQLGMSMHSERDVERILLQATRTLKALHSTYPNALRWQHEVAFDARVGGKTVRGIIDLLVQDAGGNWHIIDFKSGGKSSHYKEQLETYREAAQRVAGIDIPPQRCSLWFTGEDPVARVTLPEL